MNVKQSPFYSLNDFDNNVEYCKHKNIISGVYIWGFSMEEQPFTVPTNIQNFFPYYIGKHGNLYCRFYEHLCGLKGGSYPIFDISYAHSYNLFIGDIQKKYESEIRKNRKNGLSPSTLPNGLLYFPEGTNVYKSFLSDTSLQEKINWMMKHIVFLYFYDDVKSNQKFLSTDAERGVLETYLTKLTNKNGRKIISGGDTFVPQDFQLQIFDINNTLITVATETDIYTHTRGQQLGTNLGIL